MVVSFETRMRGHHSPKTFKRKREVTLYCRELQQRVTSRVVVVVKSETQFRGA